MSAETRLYSAVLSQAIEDLFSPRQDYPDTIDRNRREAFAFLTQTHGDPKRDREHICYAAGFDPDVVRAKVIAILEGADYVPQGQGQGRREPDLLAKNLEIARALWSSRAVRREPLQRGPKPHPKPKPPALDLLDRVLNEFSYFTMSSSAVAKRTRIDKSTAHKLCVELQAKGLLVRVGTFAFAKPAAVEPEPMSTVRERSEHILELLERAA